MKSLKGGARAKDVGLPNPGRFFFEGHADIIRYPGKLGPSNGEYSSPRHNSVVRAREWRPGSFTPVKDTQYAQ